MKNKKTVLIAAFFITTSMAAQGWGVLSTPQAPIPRINEDCSQVNIKVVPEKTEPLYNPNAEPRPEEERQLALELLGTVIGNIKGPIAFIKDLDSNKQGVYKLGGRIKDAKIIKIAMGEVVLERGARNEVLRINKARKLISGCFSGILSKVGDEIIVNKNGIINAKDALLKAAGAIKVKPYLESNKICGLAIEGVTGDSIIAAAGFENKDIIKTVNGQTIDSYQKALQVISKAKNQAQIDVTLSRGGRNKNLCYRIAQ